ncbi:MAG: DegT/DnrJ/EryC1/StrS family aminotransferase [Patescibacteria group bacterium]
MNIKLVDLVRQNQRIKSELLPIIEEVIDSAEFVLGKSLEKFERNFASYCGKKYAIGVNSGTDALKLALIAYGIGESDEVITVPNGYFSTAMVISQIGARPVFVDVNPQNYLIDENKLAKVLTSKTKAIVPVHLYGQAAEMDTIIGFAHKHDLIVIEDACQAHGAKYKSKKVPYGETGVFSFYPGKNLGCFGDGGALVTDNPTIYDKILYLRNDGAKKKYSHKMFGFKSRLDNLQAAILGLKLSHLDKWNQKRIENAYKYSQLLGELENIKIPKICHDRSHVYHLYVIECQKRNALQEYLKKNGIETGIHYPIPIHLQKPYRDMGYKKGDFPITEEKASSVLSLPMFPELKEEELNFVVDKIKSFVKKNY